MVDVDGQSVPTGSASAGGTSILVRFTAPGVATYLVVADDHGRNDTGGYTILVQRIIE